jgi:hypothetical protein
MAQHDYVIANGTGAAVRSDLNNALAAIVSNHSGATEPATMYAYQWWADTSTGLLKLRNAANNAWITLFQLDGEWSTLAIENGSASAPSIYFKDSGTDTGIYSPGTDQVAISTGGTGRLFVDASGNVGLGTSSPGTILQVNGSGSETVSPQTPVSFYATTSGTAANGFGVTLELGAEASDGSNYAQTTISSIWTDATAATRSSALTFSTRSNAGAITERLRISPTGAVGIGTTSPSAALHVAAANNSQVFIAATDANPTTIIIDTDAGSSERVRINNKDGALTFDTSNSSERARITSDGKLLVGTSSARDNFFNTSGLGGRLQIEGSNSQAQRVVSNVYGQSSGAGPIVLLGKHRSDSVGGTTVVQSGDYCGEISFQGSDGTEFVELANIAGVVDGTPGANDMPGRLVFSTTADGASSPTERMRIQANGETLAFQSAAGLGCWGADSTNASYTGAQRYGNVVRSANSAYSFFYTYSGNYSDVEFNLRGDGTGLCDGSWTGGGADYAEYFEWSDGNPDEEDRRGISVVLDGDQIRPAEAGEDPIGVISGNPSVVGDAAWNKWNGKYLRDDFGTYVQEDYEVEDEDGNTVIQQRRKLNPAYDPDQEYVNREQRPEWDCVGLMGKLRIRKGQPTGSRWIKMRDISAMVEEWLVR